MVQVQFDLFKETTDVDIMKAEVNSLKESLGNVRRGIFARHNEMAKLIMAQQEELDFLKVKLGLACVVEPKPQSES